MDAPTMTKLTSPFLRSGIKKLMSAVGLLVVGAAVGCIMATSHNEQIGTKINARAQEEPEADISRSKRSVSTPGSTVRPDSRTNVMNKTPIPTGALYTRWGRSSCPPTAKLVYRGVMASGHSTHLGGGNEYLCLVENPEFDKVISGNNGYSYIYGVEFKAHDNLFDKTLAPTFTNHDANCAVCRSTRNAQLMIPGKKTCLPGWTEEYHGYLMSSGHAEKAQRNYVCVDHAPEADRDGFRADGGATLFPVEAACGSLPCPNYIAGNELTCVVCSQ